MQGFRVLALALLLWQSQHLLWHGGDPASQPASQAAAPLGLGLIPPYLAVTPSSQVPVAFPDEA